MTNAASSVSIYNVTSALKYITRSISFSATFGQSISELKTYGKIITSFVIISLLNYASQIKAFLRFSIASISILLSPSKDRESLNSSGSLTYEGYGELGKIMSGEAASCIKKVCCLKSNCTEDESQTSSGVTRCTESGLTICNADSIKSVRVTCDNDSVQLDHEFTAAEDAAVSGFGTWNDDGDVLYSLCCFGTAINLSSGDILVVRSKVRFNKE